jgi:hypothetical protein
MIFVAAITTLTTGCTSSKEDSSGDSTVDSGSTAE